MFWFIVDYELWMPQSSRQKLINFSKSVQTAISVYGKPSTEEIENDHIAQKQLNNF